MIQNVHNVSYLAVRTLDIKNYKATDVITSIALPAKAEVLSISLEVLEVCDAITADVKINNDVIGNDIDLSTKGTKQVAFTTQIKSACSVDLELSGDSTKGVVKVRAHYFLPSQIKTEF